MAWLDLQHAAAVRPVPVLACLAALALFSLPGCEPGEGHSHGGHDHSGHGHSHGHGHGHHHGGHGRAANDPDVLDVVLLTAEPEHASIEPGAVAAAGGHVTQSGGLEDPAAFVAALGEATRFADAVVIDAGPSLRDSEALGEAIRRAGLRGVRVVVIGDVVAQPGVDYVTRVMPAEGAAPPREALIEAAMVAAVRSTQTQATGMPPVVMIDAER